MVDVHGGELGIDPPGPARRPGRRASRPRPHLRPPAGRARSGARRSCCCTAGRRRPTSTGSRATATSPRQFNVVALDHRGHGRGLQSDEPFRLADCADDVAALVDELGLGPVIVVGYSMGGPIAQLLWRRHPRRRRRPRAVRDELHVRWHATRDDPVPRRRRHGRHRRTRAARPAHQGGGRRRRALAGAPRQAVVGLRRGRPPRLGAESSKPGASSAASTHDRGSTRSTCPPPSSSPTTTTSFPSTANSTSPAASPMPACIASPAATPCARSTRGAFSPPCSTPATPSRGSHSPLPRDGHSPPARSAVTGTSRRELRTRSGRAGEGEVGDVVRRPRSSTPAVPYGLP